MSLRARMLAGMALIAIVLVGVAVTITRATEANLVRQVDDQLQRAATRGGDQNGRRPGSVGPGGPSSNGSSGNGADDLVAPSSPSALFAACAEAGVERIVHLSALGVDSGIHTPYFKTRQLAEISLNNLPASTSRLILRPSLIYGHDGASAKLFRILASLPIHILPSGGNQTLQPVHINDICEAVKRWIDNPDATNLTLPAVGAESTTLRGMLDSYRAQTGKKPALHISVPAPLMQITARLGSHIPSSPLCSDTLTMLSAGNTADATQFAQLLKRAPASYRDFIGLGVRDANH